MSSARLTHLLTAGSILIAVGAAAGPAASAAASQGAARPAAATAKLVFFEKNSSFKQSPTQIEFTDYLYAGTNQHHARSWTGTDHFLCTFSKAGVPTCDGQMALGGSMLLIHGRGGLGAFTIPIVGGTGRYLDARGILGVHDLANTPNANLTVTLTRR
jgi:hypothetical protein